MVGFVVLQVRQIEFNNTCDCAIPPLKYKNA